MKRRRTTGDHSTGDDTKLDFVSTRQEKPRNATVVLVFAALVLSVVCLFEVLTRNSTAASQKDGHTEAKGTILQRTREHWIELPIWETNASQKVNRTIHIDILTFENRNDIFFQDTRASWIRYAQHQGYGYTHEVVPPTPHTRGMMQFNKYACILQVFDRHSHNHSVAEDRSIDHWVLWVDSDIFLVDLSFSFESIIRDLGHSETELIVSQDNGNAKMPINNGIFLIRNSAFSRSFLRTLADQGPSIFKSEGKQHPYGGTDQSVFTWLLMDDLQVLPKVGLPEQPHQQSQQEPLTRQGGRDNGNVFAQVSVAHPRAFNSFCRPKRFFQKMDKDGVNHVWQPGDPVIHLTGMKLKERTKVLKKVLESLQEKKDNEADYNPCLDYSFL